MNKSILTAFAVVMGLALSLPALAQDDGRPRRGPAAKCPKAGGPRQGQPGPAQIFQRLDKNGDGKLTKDELPPRMAERFSKADADGDGAITREELKAAAAKMREHVAGPRRELPSPEAIIKRLDKNGDGKLEKSELPERFADHLGKADADGDGVITLEELKTAREKLIERMRKGRGQQPGPGGPGFDPAAIFKRLDQDGDGKISGKEMPERMKQHLDTLDKNKDGAVTLEELKARFENRPTKPREDKKPRSE